MNYLQPVKRKVFISFHQRDRREVDGFIEQWTNRQGVFIPKALGVSDNDDFMRSTNPEYVMSQIREKYLQDSTVTIVLIGTCTHSRRYVDWEIKTSLRQGQDDPNGLIGILLPSCANRKFYPPLPPRLGQNFSKEQQCYAQYCYWPASADELRGWVEEVHDRRTSCSHLITNEQDMMKYNAVCKVCNVTH